MRRKTYEMIKQGQSETEISEYMVTRYGDFVLYRPPFNPMPWLLWFGPVLVFVFGVIYVIRLMKSQSTASQAVSLNEAEVARIKNLPAEQDNK